MTAPGMSELLAAWDGLGVVTRYDRPTGTFVFVALHDDTLGTPVGGCRMKTYPTPADGLWDAMRLAEGMTHKWAAIDLPFGGGKSVLAVPHPLEGEARDGLLRRFGRLLASLKGTYATGEDLGTTPEDMQVIASACDHVMGAHAAEVPVDPGPYTALGVFEGMRAALRAALGSDELAGRSVLVEGVGDVGAPLARLVAEAGGAVVLTDLDEGRAAALAAELGGAVVSSDALLDTPCDVYAPCAVGATLNARSIPRLRCRVVAGSANNQLETAADAEALRARGILYAPDYVINAGGAMAFGLMHHGWGEGEGLEQRVRSIGTSLDEIFREAAEDGVSPVAAARRRVERVLARGPREEVPAARS